MSGILNSATLSAPVPIDSLPWGAGGPDKSKFGQPTLKEIYEQPEALECAMAGRLDDAEATARLGGLGLGPQQLRQIERLVITGCGTSYHAALIGEYLIESLARIPVEVEYAGEFRDRNAPLSRGTVVLGISQSGETADTLAALRESKRKGLLTLALYNAAGSSIARETDGGVCLDAGPQLGAASTKAFTAEVAVLTLLALYLGRLRNLSANTGRRILAELRAVPQLVGRTLNCDEPVRRLAEKYAQVSTCLYLGRQHLYPVALEGALKLKEASHVHAEGYPAAELKHGPIALIDKETPCVFLAPRSAVYDKVISNMEEIRARGGPVIAVAEEGDEEIAAHADDVIYVPGAAEHSQGVVAVVPLQLFAYHVARLRGCELDRRRNLVRIGTEREFARSARATHAQMGGQNRGTTSSAESRGRA